MNYAGNTEIIRKHLHDHQTKLCVAVLSVIPLRKTFFLTKVIFIQGAFKELSRIFHNFSIFEDFSRTWCFFNEWLFQGLCEPCWGYITSPRQVRNKQVCCHLTDLIAEAIPRFVWIVDPVRHGSSSYCSFLFSDLSWRYCCHLLCGALTSATRKKKKGVKCVASVRDNFLRRGPPRETGGDVFRLI